MKIAIDIDNTLFTCNSIIYKILNKVQRIGKPDDNKLTFKTVSSDGKISKSFLNFVFPFLNPKKYVAFEHALQTLESWHKAGHEIILLSNRPANLKFIRNSTLKLLKKHDVKYSELVIGCKNKNLFCEKYNVDILIDDQPLNCLKAAKSGIKSIFLTQNFEHLETINNLFHAKNWNAISTLVKLIDHSEHRKRKTILEKPSITLEEAMQQGLIENFVPFETNHFKYFQNNYKPKQNTLPKFKIKVSIDENGNLIKENSNYPQSSNNQNNDKHK